MKNALTTYPQMLEGDKGEGWNVLSAGINALVSETDLEGKVLVVPGGDDVLSRNQRIKELARARWSPHQSMGKLAGKAGVTPEALHAAEDYRLTFNLKRASKNLFAAQFSKGVYEAEVIEDFASTIEVDDPKMAKMIPMVAIAAGLTEGGKVFRRGLIEKAQYWDSGRSTEAGLKAASWKKMLDLLDGLEGEAQKLMEKALRRTFSGFPRSIELAKLLMDYQARCESQAQHCRDEVRASKGQKIQQIEMQKLKANPAEMEKHQIQAHPIIHGFGKMSIRVPPLLMPVKAKNKIAKQRVTEEGILPFQLYRLTIDGKVFLDPRKHRGGSVVVDISGSMGLKAEQVYDFVLKCPGATIAQYSGDGDKGELLVVADKGRIAPRDEIGQGHGGNVVDGPALEWLSRQNKPRVWVSDTQVTGVHDHGGNNLRKVCLDWCQKHHIKIVTRFDPTAVTHALHASHRKLLSKARKEEVYA